jgi:carbamoyltransferase
LAEEVADYFECPIEFRVPFMERVLRFHSDKTEETPAVVHVDGTGRVQTVDRDSSPRFHALLTHFKEKTAVPLVLNTSLNLNGEPIVNSPEDAIRTFYSCGLDVLYLGNVRISK